MLEKATQCLICGDITYPWVPKDDTKKKVVNVTSEQIDKAIKLYETGESIVDLAFKLRLSQTQLRDRMKYHRRKS
jgi:hypothetical protein